MEQDIKQRNKPTHLQSGNVYQRGQGYMMLDRQSLQQMVLENWTATCKNIKLYNSLTPYTKINSKWMKGLNMRPDSLKLLKENIISTLSDINHSNIFFSIFLSE